MSFTPSSQSTRARGQGTSEPKPEGADSHRATPRDMARSEDDRTTSTGSGPGEQASGTAGSGNPIPRGGRGGSVAEGSVRYVYSSAPRLNGWEKGDELPEGGPLPLKDNTRFPIQAYETYGDGTFEKPMVLFSNSEVGLPTSSYKSKLRAYVRLGLDIARELNFKYIWISNGFLQPEPERNPKRDLLDDGPIISWTRVKVMLGNDRDWMRVCGFVYVEDDTLREHGFESKFRFVSGGQTRPGSSGPPPRIMKLWKWGPELAL